MEQKFCDFPSQINCRLVDERKNYGIYTLHIYLERMRETSGSSGDLIQV
jgi:hypothetical protein